MSPLTLTLGLGLAILVGVSLGLLGGGGSILMVPLGVYVLGLGANDAITMSLVVVGLTSALAAISHARAGRVQWRTALIFGAAGIVGSLIGSRLGRLLPGELLMGAFALLMVVAGLAMLRRRREPAPGEAARPLRVQLSLEIGLGVGLLTGLLGAGGGFVIVPALVLFGGLDMRRAVGTSLVVIAINSVAGVLGHLEHANVDWGLAAPITGAAVLGSLLGSHYSSRIPAARLRQGFAILLLVMSLAIAYKAVPAHWRTLIVNASWFLPLLGGLVLGLATAAYWLLAGRTLGISGIVGGLTTPRRGDVEWRVLFAAGLVAGGVLMSLVMPERFGGPAPALGTAALAGLLVGVGTALANGCTSGHGVCGVSRLAPRSMAATMTFMATGAVAVYVVLHVLGGRS